jgi:hypothetical protein
VKAVADDSNNDRKKRADYKKSHGLTYEVFHSAEPNDIVIWENIVPEHNINFDDKRKVLSVRVRAYDGMRGNMVNIRIPYDGIVEIAEQIQERTKLKGLTDFAYKTNASNRQGE